LTVSIINSLLDRAKIWVTVSPNMGTMDVPGYDPDKTYVAIKVVNVGRRPVYISQISGLVPDGRQFLVTAVYHNPQKINAGDPPAHFLLDQSYLHKFRAMWPGIYFIVTTANARQFRRFLDKNPEGYPNVGRKLLRLRTAWRHPWAMKWRHRHS